MLQDDLMIYSESSANALALKFDKMLVDLAIDVNTSNWKCTLNDSTTHVIMPQNHCKGNYLDCANDEITERDIAMLFDPIECRPSVNQTPNDVN